MTNEQIRALAELVAEDIFGGEATRLELKKSDVKNDIKNERSLGGWGKLMLIDRIEATLKQQLFHLDKTA